MSRSLKLDLCIRVQCLIPLTSVSNADDMMAGIEMIEPYFSVIQDDGLDADAHVE